ncbi:MAG: hypothetical protein ABII71_06095 [Candidatus Micrarchaeota archaeon]
MATSMLEREIEKPAPREQAVLPQVRKEQVLYHPIEAISRVAESMAMQAESTHASAMEADRSWRISARVSEIAPEGGRPMHQRFLELINSVQ